MVVVVDTEEEGEREREGERGETGEDGDGEERKGIRVHGG